MNRYTSVCAICLLSTSVVAQELKHDEVPSGIISPTTRQMNTSLYSLERKGSLTPERGRQNPTGDINLVFTYDEQCKSLSIESFWKAYHPGAKYREKVSRGTINEVTPGKGISCYWNESWFIHVVELVNSQRGMSELVSVGKSFGTDEWHKFSFHTHLELGYLNYEIPRLHTVVGGLFPLASFELRYKISPQWGHIGVREYRLPAEAIKLYSVTWVIPLKTFTQF